MPPSLLLLAWQVSCPLRVLVESSTIGSRSEILLLLEEHAEADDGSVDQQAAQYRHDHSLDLDEVGMRENHGQS